MTQSHHLVSSPDVEGIMSSHVNIIYIMVSFFVGIWLDTLERLVHFVQKGVGQSRAVVFVDLGRIIYIGSLVFAASIPWPLSLRQCHDQPRS